MTEDRTEAMVTGDVTADDTEEVVGGGELLRQVPSPCYSSGGLGSHC